MSDPWTTTAEPVRHDGGSGPVTLVQGSTFCISGRGGDIRPDQPEGLFFLDTRLLSTWKLSVNGAPVQPLAVAADGPHGATFVSRSLRPKDDPSGSLLVVRRRHIGRGMREELSFRHHGPSVWPLTIELACDIDFADLFDVKLGVVSRVLPRTREFDGRRLVFRQRRGTTLRTIDVSFSQAPHWDGGAAVWRVELAPHEEWICCTDLSVAIGDALIPPRYRCGEATEDAVPARRFADWKRSRPAIRSDHLPLDRAVSRSLEDLGSLRMFDPEHPQRPVMAAGAPWFMTLFGRDSLLTGWMAMMVDPDIALGVLEALARLQGTKVDLKTEEQPGRILHEVRFGESMSMSLGDGHVYYGTADATPLFVMLLGELARWGHEPELIDALLPAADRALAWIEEYGDRDGDGYVEYQRLTPQGLRNQGWKDSWDGVPAADGALPETPIALCEVQGYVYGAYLARASLARSTGDPTTEERYRLRAAALRAAFDRDFWLPGRGWYALGLDKDKRPIDALASNMGHCLWTGIVEPNRAGAVAQRLLSDEMFSGWGIRTLAGSMSAYDPLSYHNGSVWPHDNAILVAGLMRYGYVQEAHRVMLAILDASAASEGRLPELFSGVSRDEIAVPVAYPTSCSPQAWAAAAPLSFVRSLLGLEPDLTEGRVSCTPRLPVQVGRLSVDGILMAGRRISISVDADGWRLEGLGADVELVGDLEQQR
jgi:glycogen debranching enzyme